MAKVFKFKDSQRFRIIIKGVSVYTTAKQIRWGIGDFISVNDAVASALRALENMKQGQGEAVGLAGSWNEMQVQIDML